MTFHTLVRGRGVLPTLARIPLAAIALPYRAGVWWRNHGYDRGRGVARAAVPVVSVGNLSLGGTGKTPCVEYVARHFADRRPVILSRGYGAAAGRNDEAMVLEENLPAVPHLQGADRVALAATAVDELEGDVLILDDGFQHRRLHRDLDIVLVDATYPLRRERLFPAGVLREPVSSLARAGVVLLTRCDQAAEPAEQQAEWLWARFRAPVAFSEHRPVALTGGVEPEPVESVRGKRVAVFSGIGNPAAFRRTVESLGAVVVAERALPDHHSYTCADVDELARFAAAGELALTTQKDWVKLRVSALAGVPLRAVAVGLAVTRGEADLRAALDRAAG